LSRVNPCMGHVSRLIVDRELLQDLYHGTFTVKPALFSNSYSVVYKQYLISPSRAVKSPYCTLDRSYRTLGSRGPGIGRPSGHHAFPRSTACSKTGVRGRLK
jgi:hypothetical protein